MMRLVRSTVAAIALATSLSGCSTTDAAPAGSPAAGEASGTTSAVEASTPAADETPVEGVWKLEQTRADVVRHLRESGYGDQIRRFIRVESVWAQDNWEWAFDGDSFVASWQNPDGSWRVADSGALTVDGDTLQIHYGGIGGDTTTFGWEIEDDHLRLTWQDYDGGLVKGLPDEMFWRAYLTKPLTRAS